MSTVTPSLSASGIAALLSADTPAVPPRPDRSASAAPSTNATSTDRGQATHVELSDKVKAVLAQAKTDQSVADQLQTLVQHLNPSGSLRAAKSDSTQPIASKTDIDKAFQKLTAGNAQTDSAQDSAAIDAAVSLQNDFQAQDVNDFQAQDVSVSTTTVAETGTVTTIVNGPGWSYADTKFGGSNLELIIKASARTGEYDLTYIQTEAAAASVTESSDAGLISANAAAVHSASVTFAKNFYTGSRSLTQSETYAVSAAARISQPRLSFSTVA